VVPDNHAVGVAAVDHLFENYMPNFAFLGRGDMIYQEADFVTGDRIYSRERLRGFVERLTELRHEPDVHYLQGRPLWRSNTWRAVQREVSRFLERLPKPCGLSAVDDALGVLLYAMQTC